MCVSVIISNKTKKLILNKRSPNLIFTIIYVLTKIRKEKKFRNIRQKAVINFYQESKRTKSLSYINNLIRNNGICYHISLGSYACSCPCGFGGPNCALKVSLCSLNSTFCLNGAQCIDDSPCSVSGNFINFQQ